MAVLKQRLNRKNDNGSYDTIYLETIATVIKMSDTDSTLLSTKISNMDTAIAGKQPAGSYAAASHNHSAANITSGTLAVARGGTGNTSVDTTPTNGSTKMVTSGGIYTAINSLKTSVSNGKSAVASAITDKGVSTSATASFDTMASNIRKIGMVVPATLPAGYTACNYIQTDGNAWINTGIDLTSKSQYLNQIFITSSFPSTSHIIQKPLLCACNDDNQSTIYIAQSTAISNYSSLANTQYSYFYCGNQQGYSNSMYHILDSKINYYIGLSRSNINEGSPCRWGTRECYAASNSASSYTLYKAVIYLWKYGYNQASGTAGGAIPGSKIYEFLYYYNYKLESHMLPCKNPSGVVGLYDVVRKAFYGNNGTGSLTYG